MNIADFDYKNTTLYLNLKTYLETNTTIRPDVHASVSEPLFVRSVALPQTNGKDQVHAYVVSVLHDEDGSKTRSFETLNVWIDDDWDILSCERIALHHI